MKKIYFTIALAILFILRVQAQCPTFNINAPFGSTVGCVPSTVTLNAVNTSTLTNVTYTWISISTGTATGSSINASSPSATNVYTIIASAPTSTCFATQTFTITRNTSVPFYSIAFTPTAITCVSPTIAMSPFSMFPGGPITFTFVSPAPTSTSNIAGATFSVPGTYTMNYTNIINGCVGTTFTNVPLNVTPPATLALSVFTLCSGPTVTINAGTIPSPFYSYSWTGPGGSTINSPNAYSTGVNFAGTYTVIITNTMNGCTAPNYATVVACTGVNNLNGESSGIKLFPNPGSGQFTLHCDADATEIEIYNLTGQKVYSQNIIKGDNLISANELAKGIYNYTVLNKKAQVNFGKLVIE